MDNMYKSYLRDMGVQIRQRNKYSDNKQYHIKSEYNDCIEKLINDNRIYENDRKVAYKIIGGKLWLY